MGFAGQMKGLWVMSSRGVLSQKLNLQATTLRNLLQSFLTLQRHIELQEYSTRITGRTHHHKTRQNFKNGLRKTAEHKLIGY